MASSISDVHLLTDGKSIYLEEALNRIIDLLKNARQPMFLVCVTDQARRLSAAGERRPTRSLSDMRAGTPRAANECITLLRRHSADVMLADVAPVTST